MLRLVNFITEKTYYNGKNLQVREFHANPFF